MIYPVVLCGGSGTRLWPLSRKNFPKQFIDFGDGRSLFEKTVDRICNLKLDLNKSLVITNKEQEIFVKKTLKLFNCKYRIYIEPEQKNTAAAIAVMALDILEEDREGILIIFPSDQAIGVGREFSENLKTSIQLASENKIVLFGIKPDNPNTGFGYIKAGKKIVDNVFEVEGFIEKPDIETAKSLLLNDKVTWNSGIFAFSAKIVLEELKKYVPDLYEQCVLAHKNRIHTETTVKYRKEDYKIIRAESIDYAVMENSKQKVVIPADMRWSDLGTWRSIYDYCNKDANGNVKVGDVILDNANNTYVNSSSRLVAVSGVNNVAVIETTDSVLITSLDETQNVKKIVAKLSDRTETIVPAKVHRPWGTYESLVKSGRFQVKKIEVEPGEELSLQKHYHRAEHWIVVEGTAKVNIDDKEFLLTENQSAYIPVGAVHRLANPGKIKLVIVEVQSGAYLGEDDIVRLSDKYNR